MEVRRQDESRVEYLETRNKNILEHTTRQSRRQSAVEQPLQTLASNVNYVPFASVTSLTVLMRTR